MTKETYKVTFKTRFIDRLSINVTVKLKNL